MVRTLIPRMVLLALLFAPSARAQELTIMDPVAKQHLDRAVAYYEAHQYDAAIPEFRAGYAIEPRREFLFAWAQAERLRGNCAASVPLYKKVLASNPSPQQAEITRVHLERCMKLLPRPWYTDAAGDTMAAVAIVNLALGVGLYVASLQTERGAASAMEYSEYAAQLHHATIERAVAITSLATGGALVLGAILRYSLRARSRRVRAALSVLPVGVGASF
jgi:hypothetical protein